MLFGGSKTSMVSADEALPDNPDPITISGTHAVLGTSMLPPWPEGHEVLYVGMGCFWGAERLFWQTEGVHTTAVGYQGGFTANPTYEQVCTARTGHTEAVLIVHDPARVGLDVLFKVFWENHDPTTPMRQGNDVGTQYRSMIMTTTDEQRAVAAASRDAYQRALIDAGFGEITTEIVDAGPFFYAEEYHQQYLHKHPHGYCNHGFCQVSYDS
jgi:peptide-methionine (S)-S-oxide reductase